MDWAGPERYRVAPPASIRHKHRTWISPAWPTSGPPAAWLRTEGVLDLLGELPEAGRVQAEVPSGSPRGGGATGLGTGQTALSAPGQAGPTAPTPGGPRPGSPCGRPCGAPGGPRARRRARAA